MNGFSCSSKGLGRDITGLEMVLFDQSRLGDGPPAIHYIFTFPHLLLYWINKFLAV
jgi:hypothetical protein